jgi:maltose alpha-D-glucosyltransferase/alpha-amylase
MTETAIETADEQLQPLLTFVAMVGERLGELHVLLSRPTEDEAFSPFRAGDGDVDVIRKSVTGEIAYAFSKLVDIGEDVDGDLRERIGLLLGKQDRIIKLAGDLAGQARGTLLTRTHGDFHLGQILVTEGDAVIIDFEGEPARNLAERRAKTSPLRDAAGLLRSLDYLTATAMLENDAISDHHDARRREVITRFGRSAEQVFLQAYVKALSASPDLPKTSEEIRRVLDIFLLEKAAYEIAYEARNRPKWLPIPLNGFANILTRLSETRL